jgi:hypothetical protein
MARPLELGTVQPMSSAPIYRPPTPHVEAHSRLTSLLSVCEHELASLAALDDARLATIIEQMRTFQDNLHDALAVMAPEPDAAEGQPLTPAGVRGEEVDSSGYERLHD